VTLPRRLTAALVTVLALLAATLVIWQILKPATVLAAATDPYPPAPVHAPGVTGRTSVAPLIVDGRIRVYAAERQLRADGPVDAKTLYTPRWSLRRWPQQLNGVVAIGSTVVSRWSDGEVIALDGRTGTIAWQVKGPPADPYAGLRTGASTVWAPPGLFTAGSRVLVTGAGQVFAYEGGMLAGQATACADGFTTQADQYVCPTGAWNVANGQPVATWPTGPFTPLGCGIAHSGCEGFRDATGQGWLSIAGGSPRRTPALDSPGSTVAAGLPLTVTGSSVASARWTWTDPAGGPVQVLGGEAGKIQLLTAGRDLVTLDATTGTATAIRLAVDTEKTTWTPGLWQTTATYTAIERLNNTNPTTVDHYFTVETVIIAAT
jgi:hypothetical protein